MEWNVQKYHETCGRVTEHGLKLINALKNIPNDKVMDLGCGTGVLTNEIARFAGKVIGVDASAAMIKHAAATYPDLEFYVMDACSLKWTDYFDAIFSNAVFHFIKAQDALLDNVYKALKKNGSLVCEFGASGNISRLLGAVEAACAKRGMEYFLRFYYPTKEEYKNLLERHGFYVESIITYDLDTILKEGEFGIRNWVRQIFNVEMEWFDAGDRDSVLDEIEDALRINQWDGNNWHLPNKRIQVIARK